MIKETMLKDNEYLISRFETGDRPSGQDFMDLIKSKVSVGEVYSKEEVDVIVAGITGADVSGLATKVELADEVSKLATKEELVEEVSKLATKEEIAEFVIATEVDEALDAIEAKIPNVEELTQKVLTLEEAVEEIAILQETVLDLTSRLETLEGKGE